MDFTNDINSAIQYRNGFETMFAPIEKGSQSYKYLDLKGVFFRIKGANTEYQEALIQALGLNLENFQPRRVFNSYSPQTVDEFMTCLLNTDYHAFSKYVSGQKTGDHFKSLITNFVEVNLNNQVSIEDVTNLATQARDIILNDKGPKLYAEKIERYEAQIRAAETTLNNFQSSYIGGQIKPEDTQLVNEIMYGSKEEVPTEVEPTDKSSATIKDHKPTIEDILSGVINNRQAQQPSNISGQPILPSGTGHQEDVVQ